MKQRAANKAAIAFAASLLEAADLDSIFPDEYGLSTESDEVLERAQQLAVKRIRKLIGEP